ncbi:insulinase family protein [Acidobacteria bacterium AH-259-D05]|nr:insulinase family protein [Acidobacteria bacterium AH-259-D05]
MYWPRRVRINLVASAAVFAWVVVGIGSTSIEAQSLSDFEKRVKELTLGNGLKLLVLERHQAPVVSFHTYADVGSVDEVKGITGMAHVFEHMAFKGSRTVGSKDYQKELQALELIDQVFLDLKRERSKGPKADQERLAELQQRFQEAQAAAGEYLVHDEFEEALIRAGSVGLNASTSSDATRYVVSLPSNKLELWMALESDRFLNPVLREFYKEKDVVMEERRMRTENRPQGRLVEEFLALAYKAHPYGEPVVGHMSDVETMTRQEAEAFFQKYYAPSNLTIAIVGDVYIEEVRSLAETYFGRIPGRPKPEAVETVEPPKSGERSVVIEAPSQPSVLIGYHKPSINHPDEAVFDAIADILGTGRTSRLYRSLVAEKKIAIRVSAFHGFPGNKYPGLFVFSVRPSRGHTNQECQEAIEAEIAKLKTELVSAQELKRAKTRSRAGLIRALSSNRGLARQLAFYEVVTGDWRTLFKQLDAFDQVTAQDIQRAAKEYFKTANRAVGVIETVRSGR